MTSIQRARRIRAMNARLASIEAERRQILADLLPLETEESWSLGYRCVVRGDKLIASMDHRDEAERRAREAA
jgi:hypothetical protein